MSNIDVDVQYLISRYNSEIGELTGKVILLEAQVNSLMNRLQEVADSKPDTIEDLSLV